jgi:hypothetical protein
MNTQKKSITISEIIEDARKKFGHLYMGNCGVFAQALRHVLEDHGGFQLATVLIANAASEEELIYGDYDLYHVLIEVNGTLVDGVEVYKDKSHLLKNIETFIATEADELNMYTFDPNENSTVDRIIRNNTQPSLSSISIFTYLKQIIQNKQIQIF